MVYMDHLSAVREATLNRYRLIIPSCAYPLDVERFDGLEQVSALYHYTVCFTCSHPDLPPELLLRKPVTLTMAVGELRHTTTGKTVHGIVTHFRRLTGSRDQVSYEITIGPLLALLNQQLRTHRFFVDKSVPEVVTQLLQEHGLQGWEYDFALKVDYPKREQINQYQESDLAFMERLLADVGIFYFFTLHPDTGTEVVHFADQQSGWQFGKKLPLNSPSGMNDNAVDSVWGVNVSHRVAERSVTTNDYNYREAQNVLLSAPTDMTRGDGDSDGVTYGDVYLYRAGHQEPGDKIYPSAETANFWARLEHERFLSGQTVITGSSTDAGLSPAQVLILTEVAVPATLPAIAEQGLLILRVAYTASRQHALLAEWQASPYSETRCWRPPAKKRPVISGTLMARVTSAKENDQYAWHDGNGLYRVKFDADRDDKGAGKESMPVRLAKPYGGDKYGFHFPLIQGTEVAIAFHEGDPDRPYIAHALHDSRHIDPVTDKNGTRNVIRTAGFNKLRMEDKRGEEHIKLSTEYGGKSQLSLGHLVDAGRSQRGEGFELRTDEWGAIRGGKGILITADKQPSAGDEVLAMQETLDRLQMAGEQMQGLSGDATIASGDAAQVETQLAFMREQIARLQEAVAVLSAPQGVSVTSGKHLQLAAADNLMFSAGADADMGVMKRLFIGIGEGLSLFVRKMGIKLIASQGAVTLQAQNDQLQVMARHGLEIVSTEDEIQLVAKKKITLNAGGSYITLDPYRIELGTEGDFNVRAADFNYSSGAAMKAGHPDYPVMQSQVTQPLHILVAQSPNTRSSWAGMPYRLYADGELLISGVLDKSGAIAVDHQVVTQRYRLEMANGTCYQIPVAAEYRDPAQGMLANRGLHHYTADSCSQNEDAASLIKHRYLYAELLDAADTNNKKEEQG